MPVNSVLRGSVSAPVTRVSRPTRVTRSRLFGTRTAPSKLITIGSLSLSPVTVISPCSTMGWSAILSPWAMRVLRVTWVWRLPLLSNNLMLASFRRMSPTSSAPLNSATKDRPTSTSPAVAIRREPSAFWGGRSIVVLPKLSSRVGNKLSSRSPSTLSSPPVAWRTCCWARSMMACSSISAGMKTSASTSSAIRPPKR